MQAKKCDRCGAEINPPNSVTYAGMRRVKNDINDNDYELCFVRSRTAEVVQWGGERQWLNTSSARKKSCLP